MGSLYRSEPMGLCQLLVEKDAAYACVVKLGKIGCVQFKDMNAGVNEFQRRYADDIRRCAELERSLRYLESRIMESNLGVVRPLNYDDLEVDNEKSNMTDENKIFELEKEIRHHFQSNATMRKNYNEYIEFYHVLQKIEEFFGVHVDNIAMSELEAANIEPLSDKAPLVQEDISAWFVSGIISWEKRLAFERVLWRACRRSAFVRHTEVDELLVDPSTGVLSKKSVFIVFFKGEYLKNIIAKVCDGFNAAQYPCPKTSRDRQAALLDIRKRMNELRVVINSTEQQRRKMLRDVANSLFLWQKQVCVRKAVYQALNMFTIKSDRKFLVMNCWIPIKELKHIRRALDTEVELSKCSVKPVINLLETTEEAPTYHVTNKFTEVFQSIVDAYGVASYREVNPAPFTIITFPFIFSIMFGDFAHGLLLFLCGMFFSLNEKKIEKSRTKDEIFDIFYSGRYIIILMGLFSMYAGVLYNDAFSKSLNIFGTGWRNPYNVSKVDQWVEESRIYNKSIIMGFDPKVSFFKEPYPFGVDPIWNIAENRLIFLNSMKMKISVIVGIIQMIFGIILSYCNFRKFASYTDIFTNFIPQMLFILSIFAYLCVQIVLKWIFFSAENSIVFGQFYPGSYCAPSLLVGIVNMFMLKKRPSGFVLDANNSITVDRCFLTQWYPQQYLVESVLVFIALTCVPVMFIGKPLCLLFFRQSSQKKHVALNEASVRIDMGDDELIVLNETGVNTAEHFMEPISNLSESNLDLVIDQAIHTVEFTLGCISHTASYLRLWALSLAHSHTITELSEVLWRMIFIRSFTFSGSLGSIAVYFSFLPFAVLTFSVLVLMEGLSAFLHALRLHWVEFQSKFYRGEGHSFHPFSFREHLEEMYKRML